MAPTGPDDQVGDDADAGKTTGWSWGAGVAVGLCIGVALGITLDNLAIGIALGVAFFPVFAMVRGAAPAEEETLGENEKP